MNHIFYVYCKGIILYKTTKQTHFTKKEDT